MKLGFFTDVHARADTPEGRTDDFRKAIFTKLEEVGQIFQEVDYVLFGGDLFNTPDPSTSVVNETIRMLKSWNKPIIGVVGSHDYFGYQIKSLQRTALGTLVEAGVITLVGDHVKQIKGIQSYYTCERWVPVHSTSNVATSEKAVTIVGTPHTYWLADDPVNFDSRKMFGDDDLQVQLVHGDLLDKPVPWTHVTVGQVQTNSDLVLSGHYHPGWPGLITTRGTTFVNPGSLSRLENTGRIRTPRVCIIDVKEEKQFSVEYKELTSAEKHPFKEKLEQKEENVMQDVTRLLQLIETTQIGVVDIKEKLPLVAKEAGYDDEVVEKAFELIEQADTN